MKVAFFLRQSTGFERAGIMYLSSVLKHHGHHTKLFCTGSMSLKEIVRKVGEFSPDILAYSVMTGEHYYYLDLNLKLKEHFRAFSIFGGPHPTFYTEMVKEKGVDSICIGEGEYALLELAEKLQQGESIWDIPNLWFCNGTNIVQNPVRPLNENLDDLPFPDRDFMYDGDPSLKESEQKMFFTGRGCPFRCTYCFNHTFNKLYSGKGKVVRYRSVDNFIEEVLEVKRRYSLQYVWIDDDSFTLKPKAWFEEFADKFPQKVGLPINCNIGANTLNKENVRLLKAAGCYSVWIGVECANEELSNHLLQRGVSNEKIRRACRLLRENDILFVTQNLCGLPVENPLEVDFDTLRMNLELKPTFAWSSILYPYPGTVIAEYAKEGGYFTDDGYRNVPFSNKTRSTLIFRNPKERAQIERLHKLFGIAVEFPFLVPLLRFLIKLPMTPLYQLIFFSWYGYCLKVRICRNKIISPNFFRLVKTLFSYLWRLESRPSR